MAHYLFGGVALLAVAAILWTAIREHRRAMLKRRGLLDEAHDLLGQSRIIIGPDRFPVVTGRIADDRHVRIELIADTMVTRRLPQLWLKVTLLESVKRDGPTLGALARPTGSEYYSLVPDLPEWMTPPDAGISLLMRGDGRATADQATVAAACFQELFADPQVKEALIGPKVTRVIYQASQGERAAHMFLRQAQFALDTVPAETIRHVIALAVNLSSALADAEQLHGCEAA